MFVLVTVSLASPCKKHDEALSRLCGSSPPPWTLCSSGQPVSWHQQAGDPCQAKQVFQVPSSPWPLPCAVPGRQQPLMEKVWAADPGTAPPLAPAHRCPG